MILFGLEKSEKFERCVQDIKTKQRIKENKNFKKFKEDNIRKQSSLLLLIENKQLKQKNQKLIDSIKIIKEKFLKFSKKLEELNLTNARLFYKNQTLCDNSLNERQKIKLVESISKADSVDEVKSVFEILVDSVGSQNLKTYEPKSLHEIIQNKDALTINYKAQKQVNDKNSIIYNRMQQLAGIAKKK